VSNCVWWSREDGYLHFDSVADLAVLGVRRIIVVGHEPLVDSEDTAGLQDLEDLAVNTLETGGMDGGLDGVDGIETVGLEGHLLRHRSQTQRAQRRRRELGAYHEVTLDELVLVGNSGQLRVVGRTLNLVVVVVQSDDIDIGEPRHLARRTADTASDVENGHARLQAHHVGKVVLVTGNGLVEALALVEPAEVE
jgi:hypothetical protein